MDWIQEVRTEGERRAHERGKGGWTKERQDRGRYGEKRKAGGERKAMEDMEGMKRWTDGGTEGRRDGGTEGRRDGGTEGLRDGGTEGRRDGGTRDGGGTKGGKEGRREIRTHED